MRAIASMVLTMEALIVFFASLVAMQLSSVGTTTSLVVGGVISVACLVVVGLLRFPWAYTVGSVLQVIVLATGFIVPMMFVLGAIFGAIWAFALIWGRKVAAE